MALVPRPPDPTDERNISRYVEVNRSAVTGAYLNVTFEYADADVSGLPESTLDVWKYDGSWTELGSGPGIDPAANEIQYNVTSFSTFGVFGRTSTATPTPTPTATATQTAESTETVAESPGFGFLVAVVAVATAVVLARRRRR